MDRQEKIKTKEGSENGSENGSNEESDSDEKVIKNNYLLFFQSFIDLVFFILF